MISASGITYHIGKSKILNNVTLRLANGEVTSVLGPNGSGKTTLLRCLVGNLKPKKGTVIMDEKPIQHYSIEELAKRRAVLSQTTVVDFPFTALEIVLMGRSPHKQGSHNKIAERALRMGDAFHLRRRIFPTLSGGEQQRVHLGRVLAQIHKCQNGYLFLDEPTSALDLKHRHSILERIAKMALKQNLAVCIIMHDLSLALRYSKRAILMRKGRLIDIGKTKSVLSNKNIERVFEVPANIAI